MFTQGLTTSFRVGLVTLVLTLLSACGDGGQVSTLPPREDVSARDSSSDSPPMDRPQGDDLGDQGPDTVLDALDENPTDATGDTAALPSDTVTDTVTDALPDTVSPSWPASRALVASDPAESSVTLTWTEATDNLRVRGYRLFRDGSMVATTEESVRTQGVTGLTPGVRYAFRVEAFDAAGNLSMGGPTAEVTLADRTPPTWPAGAVLMTSEATGASLSLAWPEAMDNVAVTAYRVLRDSTPLGMTDSTTRTYRVTGLSPGVRYTFRVEALDLAGNVSTDGPSVTPMLSDTRAPTWPAGATLLASDSTTTAVTLNWPAAEDDVSVTAYRVFRDGAMIGTTDGRARLFRVTGLSTTARYTFRVQAGDAALNFSTDGPQTTVLLSDREAPFWPETAALSLSGTGISGTLTWPAANDNLAVVAYRIYRDDLPVGMTDGATRSFRVTSLRTGRQVLRVEAGDAAGNLSTDGPSLSVELTDTAPPVWPLGATLSFTDPDDTAVTVGWPGATDDFGVSEYRVFRDGTQVGMTDGTTRTFRATGLRVGVRYTFRVQARDTSGLVTTDGPAGSTTLLDRNAPTWPTGSALSTRDPMATSIALDWTAAADDLGVSAYRLTRDGSLLAMTDGATRTFRATGLMPGVRYVFRVQAVDAAGNASTDGPSATHTVIDITAPTWPPGSTLSASDVTPTSVTLTWTAALDDLAVALYRVFRDSTMIGTTTAATRTFRVTDMSGMGPAVYRVEAVDAAGNVSTGGPTSTVTPPDVSPPVWPSGSSLTAMDLSATTALLAWSPATDNVAVTAYRVSRDGAMAAMTDGSTRTLRITGLSRATRYAFRVEAVDAANNLSTGGPGASATTESVDVFRPDAVSGTQATTLGASVGFLYQGSEAFQRGVLSGVINPRRVAVLRGLVSNPDGSPAPGVGASVSGHPEFGSTVTRPDGYFDLVVNGGEALTVELSRAGVVTLQRTVNVPWQDIALVSDVVITPRDGRSDTVDFATPAARVARANPVTDPVGTRSTTVIFAPGTTATMTLPGGSTAPLARSAIRATELSVGAQGLRALPAELPDNTGYAFAFELSADDATRMMATELRFSVPAAVYTDNVMGFPVGSALPVGCYDSARHAWMPSPASLVARIVAITAGVASLDITGDGVAESDAALGPAGISLAERTELAGLYPSGRALVRVALSRAGTCALGPGLARPLGAAHPGVTVPAEMPCTVDLPSLSPGSVISLENQALGENLRLAGVPFSLEYHSERMPGGGAYTFEIPILGATVPTGLRSVQLEVTVAGVRTRETLSPSANLTYAFRWSGRDAWGRTVQGSRSVVARVGYVYDGTLSGAARFGDVPGIRLPGTTVRNQAINWTLSHGTVGAWNNRLAGLGGWNFSVHHAYDPNGRALLLGDGATLGGCLLRAESIVTVAGNGATGSGGDGGPATAGQLNQPRGIALAGDGAVYLVDAFNHRVRRVNPNGTLQTVAGTGTAGFSGDNGQATAAQLNDPWGIALGSDGSLYITDAGNHRVRKVRPDGIIVTLAGDGTRAYGGDGSAAINAQIASPRGIVVLPDDTVYFADNGNRRIREVSPDGRIFTIAGNGMGVSTLFGTPSPASNTPATAAGISDPQALALGPDGSLYFTDTGISYIRRVDPAGVMQSVAGSGNILFPGFGGDGGPGAMALFNNPQGLAVAPDGTVYVSDSGNGRVRRISRSGIVSTLSGGGTSTEEGIPAGDARLGGPSGLAVGPDGAVYLSDVGGSRVRKVRFSVLPSSDEAAAVLPGDDGLIHVFDAAGRHLRAVDQITNAARWRFSYDSAGRLASVADGDGNSTTVERDASGRPSAIVGPYGHRTTLSTDARGDLSAMTDPLGGRHSFSYVGSTGLLASLTDPRGNTSNFTFDDRGRLSLDADAAGGRTMLSRSIAASTGSTVTQRSALDVTTSFNVLDRPTGVRERTTVYPTGTREVVREAPSGLEQSTREGFSLRMVSGPDPRFGMRRPVQRSVTHSSAGVLRFETTTDRTVSLSDPGDPLSVLRSSETNRIGSRATLRSWDAATRTYTERSPQGRETHRIFDASGRIIELRSPGRAAERYSYDARGRVTATELAGRRTTLTYNSQGLEETRTDPLGNTERLDYDAAGRLTRRVLADGRELRLTWDANGNLSSVTPPGRSAHTLSYTAADVIASESSPDLGAGATVTRYEHDADHNVTRLLRPDGRAVSFTYDPSGRLSTAVLARGTVRYAFSNTDDNPTSVTMPDGSATTYRFDTTYPTQVVWSGELRGQVDFGLDATGRRVSETVMGSPAVSFSYDNDDLLVRAGAETITRDLTSGLVTGTLLSTVATVGTYDTHGDPASFRASAGTSSLYEASYTRDALGRIASVRERIQGRPEVATSYTYDATGRLTEFTRAGASERYDYDTNGNRTRHTSPAGVVNATYDPQDRVSSYGDNVYTFGAAGDLQRRRNSRTGALTSYEYDEVGSLLRVSLPDGREVTYLIDGEGRRIGRRLGGRLQQGFLYNGERVIAELDGASAVASRFVYGTREHVPDYMVRAGVTYQILSDSTGSPRVVVNTDTGAVVQQSDYDPFGRVSSETVAPGFSPIPFGFAGGLYDRDTGLLRFGARDYDPETGRWTGRDPLGFEGNDTNLYSYSFNDPVNYIDPSGTTSFVEHLVIESIVFLIFLALDHLICHGNLVCQIIVGLLGVATGLGIATYGARAAAAAGRAAAPSIGHGARRALAEFVKSYNRSPTASVRAKGLAAARYFAQTPFGRWILHLR